MERKFTTVGGLKVSYLEAGQGLPVLLLHGWPTSSFLWRHAIPEIARTRRVLALDLPGFGQSDKPLDTAYSFRFFSNILEGFLKDLQIDRIGLAVHDLGGPVGLYWATANPGRIERLAILNTLVYPQMSWAVKLFLIALRLPLLRDWMVSPAGLRAGMRYGICDRARWTEEMYRGVTDPFVSAQARKALLKAGGDLSPKGFFLMEQRLPRLTCPVQILYGEADRILPDIAETVARLKKDLPQAEVESIPECGHFLQEDRPVEVATALARFFG